MGDEVPDQVPVLDVLVADVKAKRDTVVAHGMEYDTSQVFLLVYDKLFLENSDGASEDAIVMALESCEQDSFSKGSDVASETPDIVEEYPLETNNTALQEIMAKSSGKFI